MEKMSYSAAVEEAEAALDVDEAEREDDLDGMAATEEEQRGRGPRSEAERVKGRERDVD